MPVSLLPIGTISLGPFVCWIVFCIMGKSYTPILTVENQSKVLNAFELTEEAKEDSANVKVLRKRG